MTSLARRAGDAAVDAAGAPVSAVEERVAVSAPLETQDVTQEAAPSVLQLVSRWLRQQFAGRQQDTSLREAIEEVLDEHEESYSELAPEERVMLKNMLSFGELTVSDIMIPRTDIVAAEQSIGLEALKQLITEQRHTRMPVYDETLDNVKGFIHVKDLLPMLSGDQPFNLAQVLREILFVPPSMRIIDLLVTMRVSGNHMAVVIDEFGGTDGLITMEDLFEEIVGEIQDEHDEEEDHQRVQWLSDNVLEVDARLRIEKLEEEIGNTLVSEDEEQEFDTIGGLIFFQLGRVPARGEMVDHPSGLRFEIVDADPRRIKKVRVIRPYTPPA